ncbi:hypothetical protein AX16_008069 [Volvariella volvacea WC 439]|nr:hypothetical protein AX16_008069 [Volvariella volvacea WC 439]
MHGHGIASIRAFNRSFVSKYGPPVGVFVGGTAGIGEAMAQAFSEHTKGNSRIIIVGRNRQAAESIISRLPPPPAPLPPHEFIQCDVTLMRNVHAASKELLTKVPKINFLVITTGIMTTDGRVETDEGIDKKMAVNYYARWAFIKDLMPALLKAKESSEDAKVMSVYSAGQGTALDLDDLGLKKKFSLARAAGQGSTYNDVMIEDLSVRYPGLSFVYSYPGPVRTNLVTGSPSTLLRITGPLLVALTYPLTVSPADCAEYQWSGLYKAGAGPTRVGSKGEDLGRRKFTPEEMSKVWEHTEQAVGV